jgi:hypothetical protein
MDAVIGWEHIEPENNTLTKLMTSCCGQNWKGQLVMALCALSLMV